MIARWMIVGFVLWLAVTLSFRFIGHEVFRAGPGGVSWAFIVLPILMFALTYIMVKVLRVAPSDRAEAASIFAVPGLLIGVYMINSYAFVYPNLDPSLAPEFAALMFACCTAVIFAGIVSSRLEKI